MGEDRAELSADVWQVPAGEGRNVSTGDELGILECMQMEIPVVAPVSGTIIQVEVAADDQVQEGDLIAVIDEG